MLDGVRLRVVEKVESETCRSSSRLFGARDSVKAGAKIANPGAGQEK